MPSPNFGDRRGRAIDAIVLHYTGMASGEAALVRLRDPAAEVSCHYLVWEDGRVDQLVAEADRAWHAGLSRWRGEADINSVSVGIEMVNAGHDGGCPPYPDAQIEAVTALCSDVCRRRAIAAARVLGHSDIAPSRKIDPGEHFPWERLARVGIGPCLPERSLECSTVAAAPADDATRLLERIGYAPADGAALRAFQRRWRPQRIDGVADEETLARLRLVAEMTGA